MQIEPQEAFEYGIAEGLLSGFPDDDNFAGKFMFMGTWSNKLHFKNKVSREYVSIGAPLGIENDVPTDYKTA